MEVSCFKELVKQEVLSVLQILYRHSPWQIEEGPEGIQTLCLDNERLRPVTLSAYQFHFAQRYKRITASSQHKTRNLKYKCNIAVKEGNFSDSGVQRVIATRVDRRLTSGDGSLD